MAKRVSTLVAAASVSPEGRVWQLTEELRAERAHSDEMRIELETSQRELKRALRREECGAAAVVTEGAWAELQIKMMAQEHEVRRPPKRKKRAPSSPLLTPPSTPPTQEETRALRAEYGSIAHEMTKTHKAAETEWQHKVNREKSAGVFNLRELVHWNRVAQQQDAASRRDAKADAEAMATRVRELGLIPFLCRLRPFWRHFRHKASPRYLIYRLALWPVDLSRGSHACSLPV